MITTLIILGTLIIGISIFMNTSSEFGSAPNSEEIAHFKTLPNYSKDKFVNQTGAEASMNFSTMAGTLVEYFSHIPNREPSTPPPVKELQIDSLHTAEQPRITWFGHSAVLVELAGKRIFLDPMLTDVPSPVKWLGNPRYNPKLPIDISNLPELDAVLISHDHYDHLDYESIVKLTKKTRMFYVPLGVAAHLRDWDVPEEKIVEFNWWDENTVENITVAFAPSQHFSGRGLADRASTLWGSWIIKTDATKLYFSGDSGYGPHFKEVGERYGAFDLVMLECGQYNERWKAIHMMPEETAQAAKDLNAAHMLPIHWGSFTLALHAWTDPIERVSAAAKELGIAITTPKIGEPILLGASALPNEPWWNYDLPQVPAPEVATK